MRPLRKTSKLYLPISILLHFLILLVFSRGELWDRRSGPDEWERQREDRLVFEVVEVPDYVPDEKPDRITHLVSDRNSKAADMLTRAVESESQPYSDDALRLPAYEQDGEVADQAGQSNPSSRERASDDRGGLDWVRSIDFLEEMTAGSERQGGRRAARYSNTLSSAGRRGGISFNTYNWDFAPYMLAMKRKVESHLFPPYAFTHMGAISGTNVVRFIVLPDGRVKDLVLLDSDAHGSLDLASLRAIEMSLPFLPLPRDFPEDYLEVTAQFAYILGR